MTLLQLLDRYTPFDENETAMVAQLRDFLLSLPEVADAFGRDLAGVAPHWGHVTGSCWIVNQDDTRVVLVHHAKLGRWVQPGGHCDDEGYVLAVALREAREETGLEVSSVSPAIFDVDVHPIPEYWNTPAHLHYDVRFLLRAYDTHSPVVSAESRAVRWVSMDEAEELSGSESVARMVKKTRQRQQ